MAERSNAAVLKTVEGHTSGGSNPSLSAFINLIFLQIQIIMPAKSNCRHFGLYSTAILIIQYLYVLLYLNKYLK
jgi:hypothetical protein